MIGTNTWRNKCEGSDCSEAGGTHNFWVSLDQRCFNIRTLNPKLIWWCSGFACLVCNVLNVLRQAERCLIRVFPARIPTNLSTRSVWSGLLVFAHGCEPLWVREAWTQMGMLELADSCESSLLPDSPGTTFLLGVAQISLKYLYRCIICALRDFVYTKLFYSLL